MSTRRATIADVARRAGVAPSTASVVFSGKAPVSDATRERVRQAAAALGYAGPDPRAASLRRGRSGIVAVVFGEHLGIAFLDPVNRLMMDGLADGVAAMGAGLLLLRDEVDDGGPTLASAPVDAVVLVGCTPRLRRQLATVQGRGIPVVVIEGDAGAGVPAVMLDNRDAQAHMARHVRGLGHRRVAAVTLPVDDTRTRGWLAPGTPVTVDVTRDRMEGLHDVYADAPVYTAAGSSIDEGIIAGRVLLGDAAARPTAVLAQSDLLAAGVIRAAEEVGLRVPQDLSVTGFDGVDVDGLDGYRLTTMVQPATDKGRAAGHAVTAMLDGGTPASFHLTCTFRQGNTTAAPAA